MVDSTGSTGAERRSEAGAPDLAAPGRPAFAPDALPTDAVLTGPHLDRRSRRWWWWDGFRPLLLRLHFYLGLFVGPFILIAACTGLLYALTPQLEQLIYRQQLTVPVGGQPIPLADQVRAGQQAVPNGALTEVRPAATPDGTTRVSFLTPDLDPEQSYTRTAFIDPYTGEVRGVLTTFGEWLPVRSWFDALHRTLLLGDVGRVYSELAASWLWVLTLSGLGIWLVRRRRRNRLRRTLLPQTTGRGRGRLLSWHGAIGLWAALGLLFLSATGLTWSQFAGANISQLRSQVDWSTPTVTTDTGAAVAVADQPAAVERTVTAARAVGLDGIIAVSPGETGAAWTVSEATRSWPQQQDSVAVDPATGTITDRVDFADWPVAAKLASWGIDAHMGILFGMANQLALAGLALGVICMIIFGYRMWWLRRPTRAAGARLAPAMGSSQLPSRVALPTLACIAIVVGVFAPVLGASLVLFLTGDAVRTMIIDHRRRRVG